MGQACTPAPQQQMAGRAASSDPAGSPSGTGTLTAVAPSLASSLHPRSVLDRFLVQQALVEELLLPTPINMDAIHLPAEDLLQFIRVQQWVRDKLDISLPLFDGMFVLVPSAKLQQPLPAQPQEACGAGGRSKGSSSRVAALHAAIPWRLRQVLRVEVPPGAADPAAATVVLVGGDRVAAGAIRPGGLAEAADYEYLCCELADLQQRGLLQQLQVFDVAHMTWRMRIGGEVAAAIAALDKEQVELSKVEATAEDMGQAAFNWLQDIRSILGKLPALDWVEKQVLQYVELSPGAAPETPRPGQQQPQMSSQQYTQLLQRAAHTWQHFLQCKLSGQQPQPAADMAPWLPLQLQQQDKAPVKAGNKAEGGKLVGAQPQSKAINSSAGPPPGRSSKSPVSTKHSSRSPIRAPSSRRNRSRTRSPVVFRLPPYKEISPALARRLEGGAALPAAGQHDQKNSQGEPDDDDEDDASERLEARVQEWLQQLAVQVAESTDPAMLSGDQPIPIALSWLCQYHRLPQDIKQHYKNVTRFVYARPELEWLNAAGPRTFSLKPEALQQLLLAVQHHSVTAPQCYSHEIEHLAPADEADPIIGFQVRVWLLALAHLLMPQEGIKLGALRHQLPVPQHVIQYYGGIHQFVDAQPELMWVTKHRVIALVPEHHVRLL